MNNKISHYEVWFEFSSKEKIMKFKTSIKLEAYQYAQDHKPRRGVAEVYTCFEPY